MMITLGGYLITLIARRPFGLQGTRGGPGLGSRSWSRRTRGDPGAAPGWAAGAGAAVHVVAPELPQAASGSWSRWARAGPGAAPGWQRELEPQGT
jgi:hypothetical protein